jgi:hypothetical protein
MGPRLRVLSGRRVGVGVVLVACLAVAASGAAARPPDPTGPPQHTGSPSKGFVVSTVSTSADRVTSGDVLVRIDVPRNVPVHKVRVSVGGRDVSDAFAADPDRDRSLLGVVDELAVGDNTVHVRANGKGRGRPSADLAVTNHPVAGPVFSGTHQEPFYCETESAGLGAALDEDCFAPTQVVYRYLRSTGGFAPLADPADRPADLATVTIDGEQQPFIVRLERGVINRGIYEIAALYDGSDPSPTRDEAGWNEKVVMTFGGGCNVGYHQGNVTAGVLFADLFARGYAVASNSLLVNQNNCNPVVAAETAMMTKERLIEVYGPVVHTIGFGGSGGAIMQYTITHAYPGILDGLLPWASFADAVSVLYEEIADCALLDRYVTTTAEGTALSIDQVRAVSGYQLHGACVAWVLSFASVVDATRGCPSIVPADEWYDPDTNPDGVRCALLDHLIKQIGVDPETGFARSILDNTGVQYGLAALESGVIDVDEFLDLNALIGGYDADGVMQSTRSIGDPVGVENAFASGVVTSGSGGLGSTPMIDLRGYTDFAGDDAFADIHTSYWSVAMHERLVRDGVDPALHSRWIYQSGDNTARVFQAVDAMDQWLTAIADDDASGTDAERVARNRPGAAAPGCWTTPDAAKITDIDACYTGPFTYTGGPNTIAGAPITSDVFICRRTATDPAEYTAEFTAEQWSRLETIFPDGVCDYSLPGVGQVPIAGTWQSYD